MIECIITGCALVHPNGEWVSGDLFSSGDNYIFNGNYNRDGACWNTEDEPFYSKQITASNYFERRGVFVFEKKYGVLNEEAKNYLSGM